MMMRHRRFMAGAVALVFSMPSLAEAEPAGRDVAVQLDVDVSALPDDRYTTALRGSVSRRQTEVLARAGVDVRDGAAGVLRIELRRYGEDGIHYRAKLVIVGDDREAATREITCEACTDAQLLEKVDAETAELADLLVREEAAAEPVPAPTTEVGATEPVGEQAGAAKAVGPATSDEQPRRRLGTKGNVGIGLLAAGVVGLVTGGIVLSQGVELEEPSGRLWDRNGRDYGPPGIAVMAVGGVALVTGATLVILDATRPRTRSSAIVLPSPGGLVLTGRF